LNTAALSEPDAQQPPETAQSKSQSQKSEAATSVTTNTRKYKIRQARRDDGIFETGVDVVEHEVELEEDD